MDIIIHQNTQILMIFLVIFIVGIIASFRPQVGFYAVILLLPVYIFRIRSTMIPTNILELLVFVVVLGWIGYALGNKKQIILVDKYLFAGAAIICGALVSLLFVVPQFFDQSAGVLKGFLMEPVFFALILRSALKQKVIVVDKIIKFMVFSGLISASISLFGALYGVKDFITYDGRLRGFYLSPNHLAMYLVPFLPLGIYTIFITKNKEKILNIVMFTGILIALFFTKSFGAWTAILVSFGGILIAILGGKEKKIFNGKTKIIIILCVFILSGLLAILFRDEVVLFMSNPERSSLASRLQIWQAALVILRDHPLFGIGPGMFQEYYLAYQKYFSPYLEWAVPQPHNIFLAFWLQTGILGLIGFVWLLAGFFKDAIKQLELGRNKTRTVVLICAVSTILIQGLVDTTIWKNDLSVMFFILVTTIL